MQLFNNKGKMVEVDIKKVIHIEKVKNELLFQTDREVYHAPNTFDELSTYYQQFGFEPLFKNKFINVDKIDNSEKGFFSIGKHKYPVSRRNEVIIRKLLENK